VILRRGESVREERKINSATREGVAEKKGIAKIEN
jgi:hypothetical protein